MRIIIYMKDGRVLHDAMILSITENDVAYIIKDYWGETKKYEKTKVALITVSE